MGGANIFEDPAYYNFPPQASVKVLVFPANGNRIIKGPEDIYVTAESQGAEES